MARTLTPAEWAELERAQREGGIPNITPDSSVQTQGTPNAWGDLPTRGDQRAFQQRTTGYPQGGVGGILGRAAEGVGRDIGGFKDWLGGLVTPQTRSGSVEAPRPSGGLMDLKPELEVQGESPVDQLYNALLMSEHRNEVDRINPWIQNKQGSSAWGPVQIVKNTMEEARRVGNLTAEESDYVDRYKAGNQTVYPEDKVLYTTIAKKLLQYYWDKYQDPLKVANVWRYGEKGSRTKSVVNDDKPYWEEFRKVMGL